MNTNSKISVFGGTGLVGSSVVRELKKQGYLNIDAPRSRELNLLDKLQVDEYFKTIYNLKSELWRFKCKSPNS